MSESLDSPFSSGDPVTNHMSALIAKAEPATPGYTVPSVDRAKLVGMRNVSGGIS